MRPKKKVAAARFPLVKQLLSRRRILPFRWRRLLFMRDCAASAVWRRAFEESRTRVTPRQTRVTSERTREQTSECAQLPISREVRRRCGGDGGGDDGDGHA